MIINFNVSAITLNGKEVWGYDIDDITDLYPDSRIDMQACKHSNGDYLIYFKHSSRNNAEEHYLINFFKNKITKLDRLFNLENFFKTECALLAPSSEIKFQNGDIFKVKRTIKEDECEVDSLLDYWYEIQRNKSKPTRFSILLPTKYIMSKFELPKPGCNTISPVTHYQLVFAGDKIINLNDDRNSFLILNEKTGYILRFRDLNYNDYQSKSRIKTNFMEDVPDNFLMIDYSDIALIYAEALYFKFDNIVQYVHDRLLLNFYKRHELLKEERDFYEIQKECGTSQIEQDKISKANLLQ